MNMPVSMMTGTERVPIWKHCGSRRRQPRTVASSTGMKVSMHTPKLQKRPKSSRALIVPAPRPVSVLVTTLLRGIFRFAPHGAGCQPGRSWVVPGLTRAGAEPTRAARRLSKFGVECDMMPGRERIRPDSNVG